MNNETNDSEGYPQFAGYERIEKVMLQSGDCYLDGNELREWPSCYQSPNVTFTAYRPIAKPATNHTDIAAMGSIGSAHGCDYNNVDEFMAKHAAKSAKALTYDDGKAPLAYLPWAAIDEMALVQAYGHRKYKDFFNYKRGMEVGRNLSCAIRHIRDYMNGVDKDHESGLSPLAHALCRISFVLENIKDGKAIDDRFTSRKE